MATGKQRGVPDPKIQQILDRLRVTPEQLFGDYHGPAGEAVMPVDQAEPVLVAPARHGRWPLAWLWRINADTLNAKLRAELDPLKVGYCYMITRRGVFVHGNPWLFAQLPPRGADPDDGSVGWDYDVPMNICSISKFITAIAIVRLLRDKGLTPGERIGGYLPQYWNAPAEVRALTFHDLLRHESGLGTQIADSGPGNFAAAKSEVQKNTAGAGTYLYRNVNFALLRVMFATLADILPPGFTIPKIELSLFNFSVSDDQAATDSFWDVVSLQAYANTVNDTMFAPANIDPRAFAPDDIAAKGYETEPKAPGVRLEDVSGDAGSSGWHLSIRELTRLLDEFLRDGSILPPNEARRLLVKLYGLDGADTTRAGTVYRKNGRFQSGDKGMDTAVFMMPGHLDLAVFVNSLPRASALSAPSGAAPRPTHLANIPRLIAESAELLIF